MAAETKRRHLGYFRELAEAETGQLRGAEQTAAMERLALEQGNLRAALTTALENRDQESAISIVAACAYFWESRGQFFEAHEWFRRVLQHDDGSAPGRRAEVLFWARRLAVLQTSWTEATELLAEASRACTRRRRSRDGGPGTR
jgi:non-specific serine/threonine protein kinase